MIAAKLDDNGIVLDTFVVDELPLDCVECPEWVGIGMDINTPKPSNTVTETTPVDKLKEFLAANPDVAALLSN